MKTTSINTKLGLHLRQDDGKTFTVKKEQAFELKRILSIEKKSGLQFAWVEAPIWSGNWFAVCLEGHNNQVQHQLFNGTITMDLCRNCKELKGKSFGIADTEDMLKGFTVRDNL